MVIIVLNFAEELFLYNFDIFFHLCNIFNNIASCSDIMLFTSSCKLYSGWWHVLIYFYYCETTVLRNCYLTYTCTYFFTYSTWNSNLGLLHVNHPIYLRITLIMDLKVMYKYRPLLSPISPSYIIITQETSKARCRSASVRMRFNTDLYLLLEKLYIQLLKTLLCMIHCVIYLCI